MARSTERLANTDNSIKSIMEKLSSSHPDAVRRSLSGTPFNCFSNEWVLSSGKHAHLERFCSSNFSKNEQIIIRLTLGDVAEKATPCVAANVINLLSRNVMDSLTIQSLKQLVANSRSKNKSDVVIKNIKTFLLKLEVRNPEYKNLANYIRTIRLRGSTPKVYDADKGALTSYEHQSVVSAVNRHTNDVFLSIENKKDDEVIPFDILRLKQVITCKLLIITVRRPVQLSMLKWKDIQLGLTNVVDEFAIRMPMAKQGNDTGFRTLFEDAPIPLGHLFSFELFKYKKISLSFIRRRMRDLNIELSNAELLSYSDYFPILPHKILLTNADERIVSIPPDKTQFLLMIHDKSSAFHLSDTGIINKTFFTALGKVESDRGADMTTSLGTVRLRHTLGTNLARRGYSPLAISGQLGNTPKAAKYYIDMLPEDRLEIDNQIKGLKKLADRFSGEIVTELLKPDNILSNNNEVYGESSLPTKCVSCVGDRPLFCYGCSNFRPLADGNHTSILDDVRKTVEVRKNLGCDDLVLAPLYNSIKNIEATIIACKSFLESQILRVQGGPNEGSCNE